MSKLLDFFEKVVPKMRYSILISLFVNLFLGLILIFMTLKEFLSLFKKIPILELKEILVNSLTILELILISIVFFIFSFSLYELFIREKDQNNKNLNKIPKAFIIKNLDSLKDKLGKVIVLILIMLCLQFSLKFQLETILDLLFFSMSIFFISISLYFTKSKNKSEEK